MIKKIKKDQRGLASIMFALFMVLLLSLITIGFAQLVRKDQRQTLDKTLSNQAQYAAEMAINRVQTNLVGLDPMTDCSANPSVGGVPIKDIPPEFAGVEITCLTYDKTPGVLTFGTVGESPQVAPLKPSGALNLSALTFEWRDSSGIKVASDTTSGLNFDDDNVPTLRITITTSAGSPAGNTTTIFVKPGTAAVPPAMGALTDGQIFEGHCDLGVCSITITVPAIVDGYLSVMSLNGTSRVDLSAQSGASFADAQVSIDATAKSQDVIKRLVATVPTTPTGWQPGFAVNAGTLCKNYLADGTNTLAGPAFDDVCP